MKRVTYFNKGELVEANRAAIRGGYNAALDPSVLKGLPDGLMFPVAFSMHHEGRSDLPPHLRLGVILNADGGMGMLDVPYKAYEKLSAVNALAFVNENHRSNDTERTEA